MSNEKLKELWYVCEKFLKDNAIECEEDCYQSDSVYENAPTLCEDIFTIIKGQSNNNELIKE